MTILKTLTIQNAIWPKRAAHDLKCVFCTLFIESALFSRFEENLKPVWRFWELWRSKLRFGEKKAANDLKRAFCTIFMESALFSRFEENFMPVWRFWELWRSQMRFGRNVLRITWKERFVQFSWKAHSFPVLKRIRGHNDFENFDDPKCDLAETCCAWPEMCVLYTFYRKRTVFPFWREFEASVTILRTLTLEIAIWRKKAAHDLKRAFCTIFMESALFSRFEENFMPVWRFWELWRSQMRFGRNVLRITWKERFVQFSESALFFRFEDNLRPASRFWELWRSKMEIGQNVLRMTWKERFVQFLWRAHCFSVLKRFWGLFHDFENFDAPKCDLAKTCSAWPEKSVLYNFYGKRTVFLCWRDFEASFTILRTLTLQNAIWPKRASHDLKRAFCTIFMESAQFSRFNENFRPLWRFWELWRSQMRFWPKRAPHDLKRAFCTIFMKTALFSRFGENLRPVWRIWELWRSQMRFGQNVLRMTWKKRFVQFSLKAQCFPVLKRILGQCDDFENFDAPKCDLAETCSASPEKSVLYSFHGKRTVFLFWREFQARVTILKTLTLQNAIWPKRPAHDLKSAFCTI